MAAYHTKKLKTSSAFNPPVPFVKTFGRLTSGTTIEIEGISTPNPSRFTIYLQHGGDMEPQEIAMCFDVRFKYGADQCVVVRNHKLGSWGAEERDIPYFPFYQSVPYKIVILNQRNTFKVKVNNDHFLEFKHRYTPLDRIDTIRIDGDTQLTHWRIAGQLK